MVAGIRIRVATPSFVPVMRRVVPTLLRAQDPGQRGRLSEYEDPKGDEPEPDGPHAALALSAGLLEHHQRRQRGHPPQARHAGGEAHQHDRPAAAQAEQPVLAAEPEGGPSSPLVARQQEPAGVAALPQAPVLQRRELERAGEGEDAAADHRRMGGQPRRSLHGLVHLRVPQERKRPEDAPDHRVPGQERRHRHPGPLLVPGDGGEQPHQRQARRQHHRGDHYLPGEQVETEGCPQGQAAVDEFVVAEEPAAAGGLGRKGQGPGHRDRAEDSRWDVQHPARLPPDGASCDHAAYYIFHSDWIAFRPSYSQVMPYWGRLTRLTLALATQAEEPGTVEKTEFCRVVMLPSGPRYGSISASTIPGICRVPVPPSTWWLIGTNSTPFTEPTSWARSARGPPSLPVNAPSSRSRCSGVARSSTSATISQLPAKTLPGMWAISTRLSPETSTPRMRPWSRP